MEHRRSFEASDQDSPLSSRYRFTPEELRVMKECNRESFYYRSLPFAALGMMVAHVATKKGYLKASPRWGTTFKVMGAGFGGWLLGKFSYRSTCEEKLLKVPNSRLADMLRRRKGMVTDEGTHADSQFADSPTLPAARKELAESYSGSLNLDSHLNVQHEGLDDTQRPSLDRNVPTSESADAERSKQQTTYEELRQKNRDDYDRRHHISPPPSYQFGSTPAQQRAPEPAITPRRQEPQSHPSAGSGAKNKYGDVWE